MRWSIARDRFLQRLEGITNPEEKRRRIGHEFIHVFNELEGVNRVVYDITSKPPGTIEWESDFPLTPLDAGGLLITHIHHSACEKTRFSPQWHLAVYDPRLDGGGGGAGNDAGTDGSGV